MSNPEILSEGNFRTTDEMIGHVVSAMNQPNSMASAVSLDELIAASNRKTNPLETMTRRFTITMGGSIESFQGGMSWTPGKKMMKSFHRSVKTNEARDSLQSAGIDHLEGRVGSGRDAIIFNATELRSKNDFPFPLAVKINCMKGNNYVEATPNTVHRCVTVLEPSNGVTLANQTIHEMKATEDLYDAFLWKDVTEDSLRKDIIPLPDSPGLCILKSCANSRIARELANPENHDELLSIGFNPATAEVTQQAGIHQIGGVLVTNIAHADWAVNKILERKQKHDDVVTTADLSELKVTFEPLGVDSWSTIKEHPCFKDLEPVERERLVKDPLHNVTLTIAMEYTFKDDYLLKKVKGT